MLIYNYIMLLLSIFPLLLLNAVCFLLCTTGGEIIVGDRLNMSDVLAGGGGCFYFVKPTK